MIKIMNERISTYCIDDPIGHAHLIEPRIRQLVLDLNATGEIQTIACCQGHLSYLPWPHLERVNTPYIAFKGEVSLLRSIWKLLNPHVEKPRVRTYLFWNRECSFSDEAPHDLRLCLRASPTRWPTSRARIDDDFFLLSQAIQQAIN
jgi:hypothetical protein